MLNKKIYITVLLLLIPSICFATVEITSSKRFVNDSYREMTVSGTDSNGNGVGYYIVADTDGDDDLTDETPITGHTGATLDSDTSDNTFSGTISNIPTGDILVDNGDMYIIVYSLTATSDTDTSDSFSCGFEWVRTGQSNQAQNAYGGTFTLTPNGALWKWVRDMWTTAGEPYNSGELTHGSAIDEGMGDVALGNLLISVLNKPVLIINTSFSGAPITCFESGGCTISEVTYDVLDQALDDVESITGVRDVHAVDFLQGEYESSNSFDEAYYETHLQTVIDRFETETSHTNIPFFINEIGRNYASMGVYYAPSIRNAEKDIAAANDHVYIVSPNVQNSLSDSVVHWAAADRPNASRRVGYAYLWSVNKANAYRGPICTSYEVVSSTETRFRFLHPSGSDFASFTPGDNGFVLTTILWSNFVTISDVEKENANQILVTHSEMTISNTYNIGSEVNTSVSFSDWLHDNSSYISGGFPMETNYRIPVYSSSDTTSPTATITTNSGSNFITGESVASLSGTSSDTVGVELVTWYNSATEERGECKGTTSWAITDMALSSGVNEITITAWDANINSGTDTITVILSDQDSYTISDSAIIIRETSVSASDGFTISDEAADRWFYVFAEDGYTIDDKARIKAGNINLKNIILKNVILKGN